MELFYELPLFSSELKMDYNVLAQNFLKIRLQWIVGYDIANHRYSNKLSQA